MPWQPTERVTLPLPLLLFPPFPGTHLVDLFLQWPHSNTPHFAWWPDEVRERERDRVSVTAIDSTDQSGYFSANSRTSMYIKLSGVSGHYIDTAY